MRVRRLAVGLGQQARTDSSSAGTSMQSQLAELTSSFSIAAIRSDADEEGQTPRPWSYASHADSKARRPSSAGKSGTEPSSVRSAPCSSDVKIGLLTSLELPQAIAASRAGAPLPPPSSLPLPQSVEGALLGTEQRQNEEIKSRL